MGVGETKIQNHVFKMTITGAKCYFPFIAPPKNKLGCKQHAWQIPWWKQFFPTAHCSRQKRLVLDSDFFQGMVVNAKVQGTILLFHEQNWDPSGRPAWMEEVLCKILIKLFS